MKIDKVAIERYLIKNRKKIYIGLGLIVALIIVLIIISSSIKNIGSKACNDLYDKAGDLAYTYAKDNSLLPVYESESVTINLDTLGEIKNKDKVCSGSIKLTKYKDDYIKTYYLSNCGCEKNFGKESSKYNSKSKNVEVIAYYNYYDVSTNYTQWSNWMQFEKIDTEATDGVLLPIDKKKIPSVPKAATDEVVEKEDLTFYRYRDKKWKWYKNNKAAYSGFSSTAPSGYPNKDTDTTRNTEPSEWSLSYPDVYDYRTINTKTGYRWYKTVDGEKEYWQDGAYAVEAPSDDYKKDTSINARMYSYVDKEWRFYRTTKRVYSFYSSTKPTNYSYKDTELFTYSNWSQWTKETSIDNSNSSYREQETNLNSRYRVKYKILSLIKLDDYLAKDEFESLLGKSINELMQDPNYKIEIKFKFKY